MLSTLTGSSPNNTMYRMPYPSESNSSATNAAATTPSNPSSSFKRSNSMQLLRSPYTSPYNSLSRNRFAANYAQNNAAASNSNNNNNNSNAAGWNVGFDVTLFEQDRARSDAVYEQVH